MTDSRRPMVNDALRLLRLYLGRSQTQLASDLELSQSMISEIESGSKSVSMEVLERYSKKLNVRMSQLMLFAEELDEHPVKTKGRLIVGPHIIAILERLAPHDTVDAS